MVVCVGVHVFVCVYVGGCMCVYVVWTPPYVATKTLYILLLLCPVLYEPDVLHTHGSNLGECMC